MTEDIKNDDIDPVIADELTFEKKEADAEFDDTVLTVGGKHPHHFDAVQRDVPFHTEHVALNHNIVTHQANVYPEHVAQDLGKPVVS